MIPGPRRVSRRVGSVAWQPVALTAATASQHSGGMAMVAVS